MRRMGEGTMRLSLSGPGRASTHGSQPLHFMTLLPPPAFHALEKGMSEDTETTRSASSLDCIPSWAF